MLDEPTLALFSGLVLCQKYGCWPWIRLFKAALRADRAMTDRCNCCAQRFCRVPPLLRHLLARREHDVRTPVLPCTSSRRTQADSERFATQIRAFLRAQSVASASLPRL